MAIVRSRNNVLHIQWYDAVEKKNYNKTTGLSDTTANRKKAKKFAELLQEKLTKSRNEIRTMGIKYTSIKEAFEHFLKINQNKAPQTIYEYKRFYKYLLTYFDENSPCNTINKFNSEEWLIKIKQLPQQKNSIHTIGKQFEHFLHFLFEYNYTQIFTINREVRTRPEVKDKIVFTNDDVIKIFDNLNCKNENFKVLIYLLFYTGLRPSDIQTITAEKIDIDNCILKYYSPKTDTYREIAFHTDLLPILKERVSIQKEGGVIDYSNSKNINRAITRYFDSIQISDKHYSAYTFRKTFITSALSSGMNDSAVKELVGHSHRSTTDKYYNKISIETMKKQLEKFKRPEKVLNN